MNNELFKSFSRAYFRPFEMWEARRGHVSTLTFFHFYFEWKRNSAGKIIYIFGIASHSLTSFETAQKKANKQTTKQKTVFRDQKSLTHTFSGREKNGFENRWLSMLTHPHSFAVFDLDVLNHHVQRQCAICLLFCRMRLPKIWPQFADEWGSCDGISSDSK